MKTNLMACAALALALGGCDVYQGMNPDTVEDDRARLVITNAPPDAVLRINGVTVGRAAAFDNARDGFRLTQGNHVVDVWLARNHLLTSPVFATDGTVSTIEVPEPLLPGTVAQAQ